MLAYLTVSKASLAYFTHVPREESKRRSLLSRAKPILDRPVTLSPFLRSCRPDKIPRISKNPSSSYFPSVVKISSSIKSH